MHANASNWCHHLLLQIAILTEVRYLHFSLKLKDILPKKVSSDFSYTLTYLTLKYERNRIFHPCRGILILSDFYRQALLNVFFLSCINKCLLFGCIFDSFMCCLVCFTLFYFAELWAFLRYTPVKKRCRVKSITHGQCDTIEILKMAGASLLLGFVS